MARTYETAFILNAALDDAGIEQQIGRIEELIAREGGEVKNWEKWGKRRLAFEIKKQTEGFYAFLTFEGEPTIVGALDSTYRLDENIIRHMTLVKDEASE